MTTVAKKLAPKLGRKIAQEISEGTLKGFSQGAVEGFGRGLATDENPLKTAAIDAVTGTALGMGSGTLGAINNHNKRVQNLDELIDKRKDWGIAFTKQSGNPEEAINKLLEQKQGFVPNATTKEGIGNIDFVWGKQNYETGQGYGLEHIIDGRNRKNKIDGIAFTETIPQTIKNGNITSDPMHPNNNYIEDFNAKIAIPTNWFGKKRNWVLTAHPQNKSASKRLAANAPMSKPIVDSRLNFTTELPADKNSLTYFNKNLNPPQPTQGQTPQKLSSFDEWLEELKRKRKQNGWI